MSVRANPINVVDDSIEPHDNSFTLKKLLFLHRHGERTPVSLRFEDLGSVDWHFCKRTYVTPEGKYRMLPIDSPSSFSPSTSDSSSTTSTSFFNPKLKPEHVCALGQLTDVGANTCEKLGEKLRKHYVDELKFLPSVFNADDVVYQSTDVPRAQASARFLLNGLYPPESRPKDTQVNIFTRREVDEIIYPNWSSCPRLRQINTHLRHDPELLEGQDKLRDSLPQVFETAVVPTPAEMSLPSSDATEKEKKRIEPQPKNSVLESRLKSTHAFFDESSCRIAHGLPLMANSTAEHVEQAGKLSVREWFGAYGGPTKLETCRLGIGPLLAELNGQLQHGTARAYFYSGHDTTVGPLLSCVGAFDDAWPKYGANVALELLADKSNREFVQLRYNGQIRPMSAECRIAAAKAGVSNNLCPLDTFLSMTKSMVTQDLVADCKKRE